MADITVKGLQPATSIDLATLEEIKADDRHGPVSDDAQLALWIKPLACPLILPPALLCLAFARPSSGVIGWWRAGEHSVKPLAFDRSPARWAYSRAGSVPGRRSSGCDNAGNLRRPTARR